MRELIREHVGVVVAFLTAGFLLALMVGSGNVTDGVIGRGAASLVTEDDLQGQGDFGTLAAASAKDAPRIGLDEGFTSARHTAPVLLCPGDGMFHAEDSEGNGLEIKVVDIRRLDPETGEEGASLMGSYREWDGGGMARLGVWIEEPGIYRFTVRTSDSGHRQAERTLDVAVDEAY